ncbi:MAG TPA: F0F1 ATP synthase subunit B [Gemmatimonadaceae bacterium]|nr:F0F1 ATP synthase subunit B [Gemmatimonadaceae bacterium]
MRTLSLSTALLLAPALAFAQEGQAAPQPGLINIQFNLMFWTLVIFGLLYFILKKFAFGPITAAVDAREKALEELIEGAKRDREAAAQLVREHQAAIEAARNDAQRLIGEGRATAEKMRSDLLEQTRKEQQDMLERARREIETEKDRAIAQLRREAVELALAGASKVIEQNLQSDANRKLVEGYLASIGSLKVTQ